MENTLVYDMNRQYLKQWFKIELSSPYKHQERAQTSVQKNLSFKPGILSVAADWWNNLLVDHVNLTHS